MDNNLEYNNMSDEQIIEMVRAEDKKALEFLICKYKDLVNSKVNKYFIIGAEREDIIQEGLIGLYKAIKDFDNTKQNSFKSFANLCVERQLITAIKSSNRQKHIPLNSYLSLNMAAYENEDGNNQTQIVDVLNNNIVEDPLETITKKEYMSSVENIIDTSLSSFEKKVLNRYIKGESYVTIAENYIQELEERLKILQEEMQEQFEKKKYKNKTKILEIASINKLRESIEIINKDLTNHKDINKLKKLSIIQNYH